MITITPTDVRYRPPGRHRPGSPPLSFERLNSAGFTFVELIVVVAILSVLAILAIPNLDNFVNGVKNLRCLAEIRNLEKDISAYLVDYAVPPNSLAQIGRGTLRDPWGNLYQYLNIADGGAPRQVFGDDINDDYDLFSLGKDGLSNQSIIDASSLDDIVRASEGGFVGIAADF
jgi:general secretion pathway protein G